MMIIMIMMDINQIMIMITVIKMIIPVLLLLLLVVAAVVLVQLLLVVLWLADMCHVDFERGAHSASLPALLAFTTAITSFTSFY
jgi:hypothetical protein